MFIAPVLLPILLVGNAQKTMAVARVKMIDIKVGSGRAAKSGDTVTVEYTGKLTNGKVFDSTTGKAPFSFQLGDHHIIPGWNFGVPNMKIGGIRKLTIPPAMAYGSRDMGKIPPNSTLIFVVKLLKIG